MVKGIILPTFSNQLGYLKKRYRKRRGIDETQEHFKRIHHLWSLWKGRFRESVLWGGGGSYLDIKSHIFLEASGVCLIRTFLSKLFGWVKYQSSKC